MKKHLFLKSLLIAIGLLIASINTAWADSYLKGSWDSWAGGPTFSNGFAFLTVTTADTYRFKVLDEGSWTGAGYDGQYTVTRASNSATLDAKGSGGELNFTADVTGTYLFVWNDRSLQVIYPATFTEDAVVFFTFENDNEGDHWWNNSGCYHYATFTGTGSTSDATVHLYNVDDTDNSASAQTNAVYFATLPAGSYSYVTLYRGKEAATLSTSDDSKWYNKASNVFIVNQAHNKYGTIYNGNFGNWQGWSDHTQPTSTGSLSASKTNPAVGVGVTLTPSLTSNTEFNKIKSVAYTVNTGTSGTHWTIDGNTFTPLVAGSYTVTATITYNLKGWTSTTKTVSPTVTITGRNIKSLTVNKDGGISSVSGAVDDINTSTDYAISATEKSGYSFAGWTTNDGSIITIDDATSKSTSVRFKSVNNAAVTATSTENMSTVSVVASPTGAGTFSSTSVSAGVDTKPTVTATAQPGYKFASWGITGGANMSGSTDNPVTITGKGAGAAATLTATFDRTYAFVEGRFQVYNAARDTRTNTSLENGGWNDSQCYIPFSYDGTNHRFYLHTYSTPKELADNISDNAPVFYIKTSTDDDNLENVVSYWSASVQTLSAASTKKTLTHTGDLVNYNLKFSSSDESGYAVLYFDEAGIWYELEQRLQYNGNGNTGGSAPSNNGNYFAKGTKAIAGTNAYTKTGYHFTGWKINNAGDLISAGSNVTMSSNITLYAQWEADTYENVTIDDNGGSADGAYTVTYYETSLTVTTTPTKTGYEPEGYYKEVGTTTKVANANGTLNADKTYTDGSSRWIATNSPTLYTKWQAKTYTAENNIDGNSGSNGKYTATYDATSIVINTAPTRTGYNLTGYHAYGRGANTLANTAGTLTASQSENGNGNRALTDASKHWIYDGTDAVIYADWSPKTYSITLDQEGGESGSTTVTMTYDASTHTAITNPTKTGYTFGGYWTGDNGTGSMVIAMDGTLQASVDGYTGAGGIWIKDATCTLYAKWTANNYTVTLSASGETGYGSSPSGVKESVSATYDSSMPDMGTAPTPAPGYKFMGYFAGHNGADKQYYDASGTSVNNWDVAEATTLYAYFQKTVISTLEHPAAVAKGHEVTVDVNPVFNQTGATNYMDICWSLLYDNDNPVESGVAITSNSAEGKPNQVRFTLTDLSSGYYKIKAVLKANASSFDACSTGTELSTIKSDLRIAGNSTVTIQYEDASGNKIAANTSVEVARGDSIGIKAPNIIGYSFTGWTLGDVISNTCRDGGSCGTGKDSINIKADYDGYLTAKYRKKNMVYFNNTLDWEDVYVYFYNDAKDLEGNEHEYWADNFGSGANKEQVFGGNKPYWEMEHGHMTQIEGTNIWYFDYEAAGYTTRTKVSFANVEQSIDKSGASNDEAYFHNASVVYRTDFDLAHLPMFVPINSVVNDYTTNTGSKYYRGYWMNYPESTGYTLKIYDNTEDGALVKERNYEFPANKAMPMSVTVDLEGGNKTYGFKIYRADGAWFRNGGTMTNGHSGDEGQAAWVFGTDDGTNCGLTTTSAGNYTFKVWVNSDGNHQVGVHYPESTGDFRVMYIDDVRITNHGGAGNEGASWLLSSVIPGNTESDTISYFVRAEGGKHPKYKIQKCTITEAAREEDKEVRWADQGTAIDVPDSINKNGVYNFIFAKEDGNLVLKKIELYEGNFYIRVDGAGSSNWDNFRASDHLMPYSDYSFSQTTDPYSHYFTQWYKVVKEGGDVKVKNIKFVVANDYSVCVSDTIVKDGKADAYVDANGYITRSANIRFMYNYKTNEATRRYVDGAQESGSEFLMILSDDSKMFAASSGGSALTELRFSDKGNWIYEAEVYALPTATYKLKSKFGANATGDATKDWERKGEITQYFKGSESTTETLIGGDDKSDTRVKIRLLYDFKTNRVVAAYQPSSGTIDANMEINADIMFMREHQGDIEQITFSGDAKIKDIKNIYCSLKFNKYTLNNKSTEVGHATLSPLLSRYERDIFYVSFPYDVRVSDVIGFGTYGQHWIIEYYNGAERAEKGFWQDSESFWHFVTPAMKDTFTLKAGTGYIVALDLDEMYWIDNTHHSSVWNNTDEVELLFPGDVNSISNQEVTYNMPRHQCTINRGDGTSGDRRVKDSHWNVLGVPTFKNIEGEDSEDGGGDGAIVFANTAWIKDTMNLKFIYDGNLSDNSLTAKAVKDFEFKAMHAYIVQYCGDVTFTTSATPAPSSIVARRTYAEKPRDIDFRLELTKNGVMEDQTFVSLSNDENVSAGFAFGEDLSKEFNTKRANIYTFIGSEWVAGNTLPMSEQTTVIPVGVKIAADGDYTFAIPEGTEGIGVTLIDNETGIRTSLSALDYTINLSAGTYDNRFVLEISPVRPISTDLEAVTGDGLQVTGARKVMIDGLLYIVKDGKMFDAQGRQVK